MSYLVGIDPLAQYTETEVLQGKAPVVGTIGQTSDGKIYVMAKVAASQNITNGMACTITAAHEITPVTNTANPPAATNQVVIARTSITASASIQIWCQIFGRGTVRASLSALPNIALKPGSVTGSVDDDLVSASAFIQGLYLTATSNLSAELANAVIIFPHFARDTIA